MLIIIMIIIIITTIIIITKTKTTTIINFSRDQEILSWCPAGDSLISWGERFCLALAANPSRECLDKNTGVEAP